MNQTTDPVLLTRAQSGDLLDTPPLATCSYRGYRRGMGTATRITLMAPRYISLPDPAYTERTSWLSVGLLTPGRDYFHKELPPEEFRDRYLTDLNRRGPANIAAALRQVPAENGRLVLLCYEGARKIAEDPWCCHRRIFAEWWQELTGREVPELTSP